MPRKAIFLTGLIVLGVAVVLLAVMFVMPSIMKPTNTSPNMLAQIPVGGSVSLVAQVLEISEETLKIEALEGNGYDVFDKRTGVYLQTKQTSDVEIVMGQAEDVKVGAIAQFEGTKLDAGTIRLSRIVILTGYVEGPPKP